MHSGIGDRETASDKIAAQGAERLLILLLQRSGVRNQHRLVVLRSPCEKRGDEGDAHASTLIPKEIGDTRCFVVFVLGQIGVGELAYRHKERRDAEALKRPEESDVFVVGCEIDAGVLPHGGREDQITDEDHRLDADFGQDPDDQGSQSNDDESAGTKNQSRVGCRVAIEVLQHLRDQDG